MELSCDIDLRTEYKYEVEFINLYIGIMTWWTISNTCMLVQPLYAICQLDCASKYQ